MGVSWTVWILDFSLISEIHDFRLSSLCSVTFHDELYEDHL